MTTVSKPNVTAAEKEEEGFADGRMTSARKNNLTLQLFMMQHATNSCERWTRRQCQRKEFKTILEQRQERKTDTNRTSQRLNLQYGYSY